MSVSRNTRAAEKRRRLRIPHPSIIDMPVKLLSNLPIPEPPPRDSNAPRGPEPTNHNALFMTGSINQIREWTELAKDALAFEVTGFLYAVGMVKPAVPPAPGNEINLFLREHRNSGPILRVIQPYHLFRELPSGIERGKRYRCLGKILDGQKMLAFKISNV